LQAVAYLREIPAVKHIGLFGALNRRRVAQREGFDDVLLLNPDGTISEIATSNVGFVREGRIVWPRSEHLAGITMTLIHQALDEPVATEPLTLSDPASHGSRVRHQRSYRHPGRRGGRRHDLAS
jgi:branched-subunit amino acid aminotransferase/4-amino-4-deoxychorismate lyase